MGACTHARARGYQALPKGTKGCRRVLPCLVVRTSFVSCTLLGLLRRLLESAKCNLLVVASCCRQAAVEVAGPQMAECWRVDGGRGQRRR